MIKKIPPAFNQTQLRKELLLSSCPLTTGVEKSSQNLVRLLTNYLIFNFFANYNHFKLCL